VLSRKYSRHAGQAPRDTANTFFFFAHRWDEDFKKKPAYDAILNAYSGGSSSPAPISNNSSSVASSTADATIIATSVSVKPSTGLPDKSTPAFTPSASAVEPVATGEAECVVEYVYA
jgi:hypothetical protein